VRVAFHGADRRETDEPRAGGNFQSDCGRNGNARTGVRTRPKPDNDRLRTTKFFRYSVEILEQGSGVFPVVRPFTRKLEIIVIQPGQTAARGGKLEGENFH
jgi:hypothetical protein